MSHFCFYDIFTHTFKYHFCYHTYMARGKNKKKKGKSPKQIMPKKSHSLYLGLATGGIPHSIAS